MTRRTGWAAGALAACLLTGVQGADGPVGEWRHYSADGQSPKFSPLDQFDTTNVARLRVAWRRPQADPELMAANPTARPSNRYSATPIMTDGTLFVPDGFGLVEALDPGTGRTRWTQAPLTPGATASVTVARPGVYEYRCIEHPWSTGELMVAAP